MSKPQDTKPGAGEIKEALSFLDGFTNYEREMRYPYDGWAMNMERVRALLEGSGDPLASLRVVHVAGTKGKGSTCAMTEGLLRSAGYRTGIFTSPHLLRVNERIRVSGVEITDGEMAEEVIRIRPAADKVDSMENLGKLTYFEMLTAVAVCFFARRGVDAAILEVGLGGRYDATNVCDPAVAVITSISLDHTDILGEDLAGIALEKAQIIKPGRPAVIAPQRGEVWEVIEARAADAGADLIRVEDSYRYERVSMDEKYLRFNLEGKRRLEKLRTPLLGDRQMINAATAVTACDALEGSGLAVPDSAVRAGLASVGWPGRFQIARKKPVVILDGAHNADSARHLADTLRELYPKKKIISIIGLARDKDVEGFLRELAPALSCVIFTRSKTMKAAPKERLLAAIPGFTGEVMITESVEDAVGAAFERARPEDVILITGSFYVVGEALVELNDVP